MHSEDLTVWLIVWLICLAIIAGVSLRKGHRSVGLSLGYLLTLTIIHFFGALIYVVPWHDVYISPIMERGFIQSVYGVIAFTIGNILVAPLILKVMNTRTLDVQFREPNLKLPLVYVLLGFIFFTFIAPAVRFIPSVAALSISGVYLVISGMVLGAWRDWFLNRKKEFFFWLFLAGLIPFVTMLGLGFLGYGAIALLIVLLFIFQFYTPRPKGVVIGLLILYLGISFFVNYARERDELRDVVWGGESYSSRVDRMAPMFTNFEFLNLSNPDHVMAIDRRLNQNYLVGVAVDTLENGMVNYANGETIYGALLAMVPRILWPGKPTSGGGGDVVTQYTGISFAEGTSVGVGQVMEFYINYGTSGVVIGFLVFGVVIRIFDSAATIRLWRGDWEGFTVWFLPGLGLLQSGGNLAEVTSTVAASFIMVIGTNKYLLPIIMGRGRVVKYKSV